MLATLARALLAGGVTRERAEAILRPAHYTVVTLQAGPLRREMELLAQRGRLRLQESVDQAAMPAAFSPAASLGLTQREAEVLALVAEGRTNRRTGQVEHGSTRSLGMRGSGPYQTCITEHGEENRATAEAGQRLSRPSR